jgi:hypothetical protein
LITAKEIGIEIPASFVLRADNHYRMIALVRRVPPRVARFGAGSGKAFSVGIGQAAR